MSGLPEVSVIIPVFNAQDTIEDCICSILDQSYPGDKREIIVVDNNSTDLTRIRLDKFGREIRVLKEEKRGPSAARNTGIRAAGAELLAFIDADAAAERDWLTNIIMPLKGTAPGQAGGAIFTRKPDHPIQKFGKATHNNAQAIAGLDIPYAIGANFSSLKSVIVGIGMFDETLCYGEDVDLSWRMQQAGLELLYVPEAVIYHCQKETLWSLFYQGVHHGNASVKIHKIHKSFLARQKYRRNSFYSLRRLLEATRMYIRGKNRAWASCEAIFEAGKTLGKIAGSVRYGYVDL